MKIEQKGKILIITGLSYYGENYNKLIKCPDERRFKNGLFTCSNSFINVEYLLKTFPQALWYGEAENLKHEFYAKQKQDEELSKLKEKEFDNKDIDKYKDVFKTKPFDHQFKAFEISKDIKNYGLFFEQGCGKTKVTIDTASYLFLNNKIDSLIIIAPNGVHSNWVETELPIHCNIKYDVFCWNGKHSVKQKKIFNNVQLSKNLKIFSFNIESFVGKRQQELLKDILKTNKCLFVIDESQAIKNPKAKRTKFFNSLDKADHFKRILTGTPVTKGTEDLFSQFEFLDHQIIGLKNYYAFTARYCKLQKMSVFNPHGKAREFSKITGYQNVEELQDKIDRYSFRVLKKDCVDLPPKVYQREVFELTDEQKRIDNEIREEGIAFVKQQKDMGEPVTFNEILTRIIKRQQVASGYLLNTEEHDLIEIVKPENNPRLNRFKDLVERIDNKVIIWARFTQDINYIMGILGDKAVRYDGLVDLETKNINKDRFQNDDNVKYFVAKPIKGLTLTQGLTAIYYSNSEDLEKRLQSEDRCHRSGTKEVADKAGVDSILYIDLQARNSIDNKIIQSLRKKKKMADTILKDPESFFME